MAKIVGGTAATSMLIPDWNQTNPNRADYIKNKPFDTVDDKLDANSTNPVQNKALAAALENVSGVYVGEGDMPEGYSVQVNPNGDATTEKPWELIESVTLKESVNAYGVTPSKTYKELFVEGVLTISSESTTANSVQFIVGGGSAGVVHRRTLSVSNGTTVYYRAHGRISPAGKLLYDVTMGTSQYEGALSLNAGSVGAKVYEYFEQVSLWVNSSTHIFGVGSTFKVWGR